MKWERNEEREEYRERRIQREKNEYMREKNK